MTRAEIIEKFRAENPEITENVANDSVLYKWCLIADKEICAATRCITTIEPTTISTTEDDERVNLSAHIDKFYDIDEYPGGGVCYNDDRLEQVTKAQLDEENPSWRDSSSGTPKKYFRRGNYIYFDKPIDSNAYDITVDAVLISDDFNSNNKTPYNQLEYLEPFHDGINKYLQWRGKAKLGKDQDAIRAKNEYLEYTSWMKKLLSGGKQNVIFFTPPN